MKPKPGLSALVPCVAIACWVTPAPGRAATLKAQEPEPVVVRGVNVVDVDAGSVVRAQEVTVVAGRLVGVEPSGSSPLPERVTVLDGRLLPVR